MRDSDLNAFLASVRRTRFVDYLDPLGETAQNAFERRLSWARVSQHDPAYADEARFLLDNAETLREVLRRELEEDDWIEEADVGREWETRPSRSIRMRENDRVTEIFQADDIEIGPQGRVPAGRRAGPDNLHQARPVDRGGASSRGGRALSTPPPGEGRLRDGRIGRSTPEPAPSARVGGRVGRSPEVARRASLTPPPSDLVQSEPGRGARQSAARGHGASSLPPLRDGDGRGGSRYREPGVSGGVPRRERGVDMIGRTNPGSPAPNTAGRWQTPMRAEVSLDDDEATTVDPRDEVPAPVPMTAARSGRSGRDVPIREVDLEDWESPDDPVSSTGIMRLEDVTAPPMAQETVIGVDNMETMVRPSPVASAAVVMDDAATRPSAATRLRRPDPEIRMGGSGSLARSSLRADPPRRRSRLPMMAMGLLGMMGLVVAVGGVIAVPIVYTQTDWLSDLNFGSAALVDEGDAAPIAPSPPVEPAPEPSQAPPQGGDAGPAGATPGASGPEGVANAASAGANAPGGGQASQPAPQPPPAAEPIPEPKVGKAPAPEPVSSLPPVDVQGLWVGSTKPNDKSLKITVLGQTEGMFEGTVDMQNEDQLFDSFAIQGTVDGNGVITFRGNGITFVGKVDASGQRASGTYSTRPGGPSSPWSAVHPN